MHGKTGFATKKDYDRARYLQLKAKREAAKPTDPIIKLTNEERAYIAGLVDGEGSIYMFHAEKRRTCYPAVCIAMTHKGVIEWLTDKLQSAKIQLHNSTNLRREPHLQPQYRFLLHGKRAQLLCKTILPYLRVKNKQAEVVKDFPCDYRIAPSVKIEETNANELRMKLKKKLDELNAPNSKKLQHIAKQKRDAID